jgi:hypothetical protein
VRGRLTPRTPLASPGSNMPAPLSLDEGPPTREDPLLPKPYRQFHAVVAMTRLQVSFSSSIVVGTHAQAIVCSSKQLSVSKTPPLPPGPAECGGRDERPPALRPHHHGHGHLRRGPPLGRGSDPRPLPPRAGRRPGDKDTRSRQRPDRAPEELPPGMVDRHTK